MSLTSIRFFVMALVLIIVYFSVPKKCQWWVLLAASLGFYCLTGPKNMVYILVTATSTYIGTRAMERIGLNGKAYLKEHKAEFTRETKKLYKNQIAKKRKWIMIACLVLNFGMLGVFKYANFVITQINAVIGHFQGNPLDMLELIIPLGISFYTFQTMGYLVDVYWEKVEVQHNYGRLLLFVSFFPQITQGPISDYQTFSGELFSEHRFEYQKFAWGAQRFVWGLVKKLALADTVAVWVNDSFANFSQYTGITVLVSAFCYSIQIYADFSGYMDMMCGLCEMMGIKLTENFERPYFSKSIAEYWRRWHISLGAWFKTYIYYPVAVAKWNQNIGKKAKKKLGKTFGQTVPASIALVVVWFATGLWHGASWAYIAWGLVNGIFIIASLWLEPVYDKWKAALHINDRSFGWKLFVTLRTFILVTFIKVLPEVGTLSDGIHYWGRIFTNHTIPTDIHELLPFMESKTQFFIITGLTLLLFVVSLLQRRRPVRVLFNKLPFVLRIAILSVAFVMAFKWGWDVNGIDGGFLYAQF